MAIFPLANSYDPSPYGEGERHVLVGSITNHDEFIRGEVPKRSNSFDTQWIGFSARSSADFVGDYYLVKISVDSERGKFGPLHWPVTVGEARHWYALDQSFQTLNNTRVRSEMGGTEPPKCLNERGHQLIVVGCRVTDSLQRLVDRSPAVGALVEYSLESSRKEVIVHAPHCGTRRHRGDRARQVTPLGVQRVIEVDHNSAGSTWFSHRRLHGRSPSPNVGSSSARRSSVVGSEKISATFVEVVPSP